MVGFIEKVPGRLCCAEELPWLQLGRLAAFWWVDVCWAELLWASCGRAVNPGTALAHLRQTKGLGKSKSVRDTKIEIKLLFRIIYCSSDRQELFYRRHVWAVCIRLVAGVCLRGRQRFLVCSSFLWRWKMQVQVVAPASANPGLCKPHSCYRHL